MESDAIRRVDGAPVATLKTRASPARAAIATGRGAPGQARLGASGQDDGAAVEPGRLRRSNSPTVWLISQACAPDIARPMGEALISVDERAARLALTVRTMAQMPGIIGKIAVYMPEK